MDEHELGERLLVLIRSRWEGVEGYQNVSAVCGSDSSLAPDDGRVVSQFTSLENPPAFVTCLLWSPHCRSRRAYV